MKKMALIIVSLFLLSCNSAEDKNGKFSFQKENPKPIAAVPTKMDSKKLLIRNAKIMTAAGKTYENANILMEKGVIQKIFEGKVEVAADTEVIDGTGTVVTPGLIDIHSHMGVYPFPTVHAHEDGNEMVRPVTPDVWAEHAFWPQDPAIWRALAGGVTTIQVLHGSANLIGGRSFTAKLIPKLSGREMRFAEAPQGMKMACGENPKRVYGKKGGPQTRMGNVAGYRKAFQEAVEYMREWNEYEKKGETSIWSTNQKSKGPGKVPKRNLVHETLAKVIKGEILVHFHCYRADDISAILDVANEFGFKIKSIHHGLSSYKIRHRLAKEETATATWTDWYGFKIEANDAVTQNLALLEDAGAKAIIHSDSPTDIRFLNLEAGKGMIYGRKIGIPITEEQALRWATANAAWAIGVEDKIGTLEVGKMADVVVWDGHPFSIYTKTKYVIINGKVVFDREKQIRPESDFEIGQRTADLQDGRDFNPPKTSLEMTYPELDPKPRIETIDNTFVIKNAKVFDGNRWLEKKSVFVVNGKITDAPAPNALEIDGQGKFVTPGLIESATTLGLYEIEIDSYASDHMTKTNKATPDNYVVDALNINSAHIPVTRDQGITTALSLPANSIVAGHMVGFDLFHKKGNIKNSVALVSFLQKKRGKKSSRSMEWRRLRQVTDDAISYLKNPASYNQGNSRAYKLSERDLKAMQTALKGQVPWVMELHQQSDIEAMLRFRSQLNSRGYQPQFVIAGGAESWMVADKLAKAKIPVIVTPSEQVPTNYSKLNARFDLAAYLDSKNVPLILSIFEARWFRRTRQEAGFAVKYGLTPEKALKAITLTPSNVFGLNRGQLKAGKIANLVLWNQDPLEPTSVAERIWIDGQEMNMEHRQKLLARKYYNIKQ